MCEVKFDHPHVPFRSFVDGGLGIGREIKIRGKAEYKHEPRFCINLGVALNIHQTIALHISPRHQEKAIVITHMNDGRWGIEQRYHNPIHNKHHFEFKITVSPQGYSIHLDGRHLASMPFNIAPHLVNHIEIEGGVKIDHIHVKGHAAVMTQQIMSPYGAPPVVFQQQQVPHMVVMEPYYQHGYHHHHHCN